MGTKNTKSVGNTQLFYIQQAAKMCPYPVNISEGTIDIPQDELELEDITVAHLVSLGFRIKSCVPGSVIKREVFNPSVTLTAKVIERVKNEFLPNDTFRIKSTDCELEIVRVERGKVQLKYTNRPAKHDLLASEEQLKKAINNEQWIRI